MGGLRDLGSRLVGEWSLEAVHHLMPDTVITGTAHFEWLDGAKFLIYRTVHEHPDFPDALSLLGDTAGLQQHYFDVRGIHRLYTVTITADGWTAEMGLQPDGGFGQRLSYTFDGPGEMSARGYLSHDGQTWEDDIVIGYRRVAQPQS